MEADLTALGFGRRGKQSQDGVCQGAFATAGFAEDSEDFAGAKVERDFIEGAQAFAVRLGVGDAQAVDAK